MVAAVRAGRSPVEVAREFGVSRQLLWRWVRRAEGQRLDRVDWSDRPAGRRRAPNRTSPYVEALVVKTRVDFQERSVLGEHGDEAIHDALVAAGHASVHSVRTIGRILQRSGVLERGRRVRRPAPPRGWYLPEVARGRAELDSFDVVEGLTCLEDKHYEVLTGLSLRGRLASAWPMKEVRVRAISERLLERWEQWGLPRYAQFDNDTRFQGAHFEPDTIGRVTRLCLALGVVVVFSIPREHGIQAGIESFNGLWQRKVRHRFRLMSLRAIRAQSVRYIDAHRARHADTTVLRTPFPRKKTLDLRAPVRGLLVYLRRADDRGTVRLLGRTFPVDHRWAYRIVRSEVDLDRGEIRFVGLRRSEPEDQPLLRVTPHRIPVPTRLRL